MTNEDFQKECDERVRRRAEWLEDLFENHREHNDDNEEQSFDDVVLDAAYNYDCEFHVDIRGDYRGVEIMIDGGGPTILIDTMRHGLVLTWGSYSSYYGLSSDLCDYVDEMMEDDWNAIRYQHRG